MVLSFFWRPFSDTNQIILRLLHDNQILTHHHILPQDTRVSELPLKIMYFGHPSWHPLLLFWLLSEISSAPVTGLIWTAETSATVQEVKKKVNDASNACGTDHWMLLHDFNLERSPENSDYCVLKTRMFCECSRPFAIHINDFGKHQICSANVGHIQIPLSNVIRCNIRSRLWHIAKRPCVQPWKCVWIRQARNLDFNWQKTLMSCERSRMNVQPCCTTLHKASVVLAQTPPITQRYQPYCTSLLSWCVWVLTVNYNK